MPDPVRPLRTPREFAAVIAGAERPLVVGGQAVGIWAEVYVPAAPALGQFRPFGSKDADIFGTRQLAQTLALRSGWEFNPVTQPDSIMVASLTKKSSDGGPPLLVEVLREVNGLGPGDLAKDGLVQLAIGEVYRIPEPSVLLKAKLYNIASLGALDRPQDLKHARMLMHIVPQHLNEMLAARRSGAASEENVVGAINYLRSIVTWAPCENAGRAHRLDFRELLPTSVRFAGGAIGAAAATFLHGLPEYPKHDVPDDQRSPGFRV